MGCKMTIDSGLQWSSRWVFLLAAIGTAVGLGNIWRFPYTAGVSGGGAFVIVYLGAVLLLALPVLLAELMIGRRGAAGPPAAIEAVATESGRSRHWRLMGIVLGALGATLSLSFYAVVGAWTIVRLQDGPSATARRHSDGIGTGIPRAEWFARQPVAMVHRVLCGDSFHRFQRPARWH